MEWWSGGVAELIQQVLCCLEIGVIEPFRELRVYGVEQFEPLFDNYRMILHCGGAPTKAILDLRDELTQWKGRYTDIVMAMWIARDQSEAHFVGDKPELKLTLPNTPAYMRRLRSYRR